MHPPKDATIKVQVMRDHGVLAMSHSSRVGLSKGSVHCMQLPEAEPLIRQGVLQPLDANG